MEKTHVISVWVENKFGVLSKVSGLFASRGYNIISLTVGETFNPKISRMTIVVKGDDRIMEQVKKQLHKLIDTIKIVDFIDKRSISKELAFIKVNTKGKDRTEVITLAKAFDCRIVDVGKSSITVETTDHPDRVNDFLKLIKSFGIVEIARSGVVAVAEDEK